MNFLTKALNKLFKSGNQQELNKIKPIIGKINDLEKNFLNFSPEDFAKKTAELKPVVLCFAVNSQRITNNNSPSRKAS